MTEGEYSSRPFVHKPRDLSRGLCTRRPRRYSEVINARGNTCVLFRIDIFEILEKGHMSVISIFSWAILLFSTFRSPLFNYQSSNSKFPSSMYFEAYKIDKSQLAYL